MMMSKQTNYGISSAFACLLALAPATACVKSETIAANDEDTESDAQTEDTEDTGTYEDMGEPMEDLPPDLPGTPFECPQDGVRGKGKHRLFVQGHDAPSLEDGSYPFLHEWTADDGDAELCDDGTFVCIDDGNGEYDPGDEPCPLGPEALVHGEHYLVGAGSFAEFRITLCDDITGDVTFYVPNFDEAGSEALHQLFVVHDGEEFLVAEAFDDEAGMNGYNPFIRVVKGEDPAVVPGDELLMRSTNLNGIAFSVMVFAPPSEYETWVTVEVP